MQPIRRAALAILSSIALIMASIFPAHALPQLMVDMQTGEVLFENDAGAPWHPASLTKLMTALIAFDAVEAGRASLSTPVVTSANALSVPPSKMGLPVDTAITLEDALYLLIIKSANDIAVAIAETIGGNEANFVFMMNQRAAQMGLTGTHFANPHGLHDPTQVTTARDMAIIALTIRARYPQYDALFSTRTVEHGQTRSHSNNELLTRFAGTDGMKTGYVCASGLNLVATASRNGRNLMAVTLGASSVRERGEMTAQMLFSGFAGGYRGTGRSVMEMGNSGGMPVDMRPNICGSAAGTYVQARTEAFPLGLEGQLSYLTDTVDQPAVYRMSVLGRLRDVPLPRPRPGWMPEVSIAVNSAVEAPLISGGDSSFIALETPAIAPQVPLPRPRPHF